LIYCGFFVQITDTGAAALATAVRVRVFSLVQLISNYISHRCCSVQVNTSLNELFLIGNPITSISAKAFVDAFEANPALLYYVGPGGPLKKKATAVTACTFFWFQFDFRHSSIDYIDIYCSYWTEKEVCARGAC
jgi:hypothetical protein